MVTLINPHTGKPVEAEGVSVGVLEAAGFRRLEPPAAPEGKRARSKKSS